VADEDEFEQVSNHDTTQEGPLDYHEATDRTKVGADLSQVNHISGQLGAGRSELPRVVADERATLGDSEGMVDDDATTP
jgi:hypothetical protein